jgi:hypothetical protein
MVSATAMSAAVFGNSAQSFRRGAGRSSSSSSRAARVVTVRAETEPCNLAKVADGTSPCIADRVTLGTSGLSVSATGVGAWAWGDRSGYWGGGCTSWFHSTLEPMKWPPPGFIICCFHIQLVPLHWGSDWKADRAKNVQAYRTLLEGGVDFIDTAEVYGFGKSEELLNEFMVGGPCTSCMGVIFIQVKWLENVPFQPLSLPLEPTKQDEGADPL